MLARGELQDPMPLLIGNGAIGWQHIRQAGLIDFSATYSVHNQWLQVMYGGGLVGLGLLIAALALLVKQAGAQYRPVVGCVLAPVLCLAITERPWAIDYLDWLIWALPGALLCVPRTSVGGTSDLGVFPSTYSSQAGTTRAGTKGSGRSSERTLS